MRIVRLHMLILLAAVIVFTYSNARGEMKQASVEDAGATAKELEHRLFAPCCWRETLAVHESPIATALRKEIRQRIAGGESVAQVEADLVARYGKQIRAQLPENFGYIIFALAVGFGLFLLYAMAKSSSVGKQTPDKFLPQGSGLPTSRDHQKYEALLDDDLDRDGI